MRVVFAPDSFGGLASADRAARWLAQGWAQVAGGDDRVLAPMSDGGPGFAAVIAAGVPNARTSPVTITGPTGVDVDARIVRVETTVYVESALGCGLELVRRHRGDVRTATTVGVGQLISAAAAATPAVETVVVGLGGSGTNDGGAGMWAALGAEPRERLQAGGLALSQIGPVSPPADLGVALVAATDVDNPLLGLTGASAVFGPQKGADEATVMSLDLALERWADAAEVAVSRAGLRETAGAGAAGGLGFGLLALGARRVSGVALVSDLIGLRPTIAGADLVITGEGRYDGTSLRGKVACGVAEAAAQSGVPCVVAAGQSVVGAREAAAHGVEEVWSAAELLGSVDAAMAPDGEGLRALGRAIAASWSR